MTYTNSKTTTNGRNAKTNTETGVTIVEGDTVTVGKSKNVWDVAQVFPNGKATIELHRQSKGRVTYRRFSMDELTVVDSIDAFDIAYAAEKAAEKTPKYVPTAEEIAECVADMKAEILADIADGTQPADVADFGTLHDYVDANCYGGMCDDDNPRSKWDMDALFAIQEVVHQWLVAGRPAAHMPCNGAGLECTVEAHDHFTDDDDDAHTLEGARLCNDCGAPTHWDETTQDYWHDAADAPECFLIHDQN